MFFSLNLIEIGIMFENIIKKLGNPSMYNFLKKSLQKMERGPVMGGSDLFY